MDLYYKNVRKLIKGISGFEDKFFINHMGNEYRKIYETVKILGKAYLPNFITFCKMVGKKGCKTLHVRMY